MKWWVFEDRGGKLFPVRLFTLFKMPLFRLGGKPIASFASADAADQYIQDKERMAYPDRLGRALSRINNLAETKQWLRGAIDEAMIDWPRNRVNYDLVINAVSGSQFGFELEPLLEELRNYWNQTPRGKNPLLSERWR